MLSSARRSLPLGNLMSRAMIVRMIAMTPSLNVSSLPLAIGGPSAAVASDLRTSRAVGKRFDRAHSGLGRGTMEMLGASPLARRRRDAHRTPEADPRSVPGSGDGA